ncbi:MAG TPA: HEPN domain-containing protein [Sphingopyxis sp.]|nr:HEPN domain-containing protein [Sphingopyxis sp.]
MKKASKDELVVAVAFILAEVARLQKILREGGLAALPRDDAMHWLPDAPDTGAHILCGRAASERIAMLADHAGRAAGVMHQVAPRSLDRDVRTLISRRFLAEKRPVTLREVERALAEAGKLAAAERSARAHFIPCHLVFVQDPPQFAIGPVRFLSKARFRARLAQLLWESRDFYRGSHRLLRDTRGYYASFGWVAELDIANCDRKTSDARALEVVTRAIDCLHLLIGPGHSRKMRVGGPDLTRDLRGSVSANADGLRYEVSFPTAGHVGFEEGWFARFADDWSRELPLCALALEAAIDPGLARPLSHRFLDAIHWYGEAVRDPNPAARVVKYITALERMLMTEGANEKIAPTIAERVAALCCERGSALSHAQWHADAHTAYSLRSNLVHGSLSPKDRRIMDELSTVARVSRFAIIGALKLIGEGRLTDEAASSAKLKRLYDSFVDAVRTDLGLTAVET